MIADPAHLTTTLERFEQHAWRCSPVYAQRVREHFVDRLRALGVEIPIVVALEEVPIEADDAFAGDFDFSVDVREAVDAELEEIFPEEEVVECRRGILVVNEGTPDEVIVPVSEVLCIGRGGQNDLKLHDNKVSRYHCQVIADSGGRWRLQDLKSANGTLINGEMYVDSGRRLFGGEEIIVGNTFLRFRLRD